MYTRIDYTIEARVKSVTIIVLTEPYRPRVPELPSVFRGLDFGYSYHLLPRPRKSVDQCLTNGYSWLALGTTLDPKEVDSARLQNA